jgi:hypothetical protein
VALLLLRHWAIKQAHRPHLHPHLVRTLICIFLSVAVALRLHLTLSGSHGVMTTIWSQTAHGDIGIKDDMMILTTVIHHDIKTGDQGCIRRTMTVGIGRIMVDAGGAMTGGVIGEEEMTEMTTIGGIMDTIEEEVAVGITLTETIGSEKEDDTISTINTTNMMTVEIDTVEDDMTIVETAGEVAAATKIGRMRLGRCLLLMLSL